MKRSAFALAFISALLFSAVAGNLFVKSGKANPAVYGGKTAPPENAESPTITVFSPNNDTVLTSNSISLTFNVTVPEDYGHMLTDIWFVSDWQGSNTSIYHLDMTTPDYINDRSWITNFSYNTKLTEIPEGKHSIEVFATSLGKYSIGVYFYDFVMTGSSSVTFTFSTDRQLEPTPSEPFSTVTVIAVSVAAAVVIAGLLVCFKKHKRGA